MGFGFVVFRVGWWLRPKGVEKRRETHAGNSLVVNRIEYWIAQHSDRKTRCEAQKVDRRVGRGRRGRDWEATVVAETPIY